MYSCYESAERAHLPVWAIGEEEHTVVQVQVSVDSVSCSGLRGGVSDTKVVENGLKNAT